MRLMTFILGGVVMLTGTLSGQEKVRQALPEIGELNEAYVTAFNSQQADKLAQLFSADADFTLLTGQTISGRQEIAAAHKSFFKNNPEAKVRGQQQTVRLAGKKFVIATGKWSVTNGPKEYPSAGLWSTVVGNEKGQWRYEVMRLMIPAKPKAAAD